MKKVYFLVFDTVNRKDEAYIDVNMMKDFECYDFLSDERPLYFENQ